MQQFPEDGWFQFGTCFGDRAFSDAAKRIWMKLFEECLGRAPNAAEHKAGKESDKTREREFCGAVELGRFDAKSIPEPLAIYELTCISK